MQANLLGASYLRLGEVVIERITVTKIGVGNRGGNGGGCFGIKVSTLYVNAKAM